MTTLPPMDARLIVRLLGGCQILLDGQPLGFGYDKTRTLLAYLVRESVHAPLGRAALAELFWPHSEDEAARINLRRTLHDLRQTLTLQMSGKPGLKREWLVTDKQHIGFQFQPPGDYWLDVDAFMAPMSLAPGEAPEQFIRRIESQLALYRGDFLQGVVLPEVPDFESWLTRQRGLMRRQAVTLLRAQAQQQIALGQCSPAVDTLNHALTLDACAEDIHCLLMQVLAQSGRNAEALHQFDVCRTTLQKELGSEPAHQTRALVRTIRRGEISPSNTAVTLMKAQRQRVCVLVCELKVVPWRGDEVEIERLVENHGNLMDIVTHLGGYGVALYANRFIAYFGYPHAHEHSARRTVDAALDLLQHAAVTQSLEMRIGGYCGWMINDARFHLPDATGIVTRKAVDLAQYADWGQAIIGPMLARQVEGYFNLDALQTFPGITGHRVRSPRLVSHPMDAPGYQTTPFIGRTRELRHLRRCWTEVRQGEIRSVLICAEAGMGKSRLIRQFQEDVVDDGGVCRVLRCLPEFSGTPFYPCIELLERLLDEAGIDIEAELGIGAGQTPDGSPAHSTEQRLDYWLDTYARALAHHRESYAELLHLPLTEATMLLSKQVRRQRVDRGLFELFTFLARQSPTLFVVEDLHWADATSLEWLQRCLAQATVPGMLLISARPDLALPNGLSELPLSPLSEKQAIQLVRRASNRNTSDFDETLLPCILQRADGVPLYLEEMARLLKKGSSHELPATLWNLLGTQLEAAGNALRLAQQAAVIGRFFDLTLLRALWDGAADDFEPFLEQLCATGLVVRRNSEVCFRHALFRDAACETLAHADKKQIHARLVQLYEGAFSTAVQRHPEQLARHLAEAGDPLAAARVWLQAGQQAAESSMYQEAILHLESGIAMVHDLADGDILETRLQSALGTIWLALRGYGAEEAKTCFTRALELSRGAEDDPALFPVMWGLWLGGRSCTPEAYPMELVHKLERIAQVSGQQEHMMQVHYAYGNNLFWMARHDEAISHLQAALEIGQTQSPAALIRAYGEDTRISSTNFLAWAHWLQGRPQTALSLLHEILAVARPLHHANTLGFALTSLAMLHRFMLDPEPALRYARELAELAQQHGLDLWLAVATGVEGWALAALGDPAGLQKTATALMMARMAMSATEPTFCAMHVGALYALGDDAECVVQAEEAIKVCDQHLDYYFVPELWRMRGTALSRLTEEGAQHLPDTQARDSLQQALSLATAQGAHTLALRAAQDLLSLTRLPRERKVLKARIQTLLADSPELS